MSETNKDDPVFNVKLTEVIEKYPCIYDYTKESYSKREITEKAWAGVAKEMNESVTYCKDKWKNLRTAFSRSMRKPPSGSATRKKSKDYYLFDAMQFILPYMKSKPSSGNLPSLAELTSPDSEKNDCTITEDVQTDSNNAASTSEMNYESPKQCNKRVRDISPVKASTKSDEKETRKPNAVSTKYHMTATKRLGMEADKSFIEYINSKQKQKSESNPDLEFLKSLLPDINKMTDYQKRQFKRRTLKVIDSILCDAPMQNTQILFLPSSTPSSSSSNYSCQTGQSNATAHSEPVFHELLPSRSTESAGSSNMQNYIQNFENYENDLEN